MGPSESLLSRLGVKLPPKSASPSTEQREAYEREARAKTKDNPFAKMIEGTGGFMEGLTGVKDFQPANRSARDYGNMAGQMTGIILPFMPKKPKIPVKKPSTQGMVGPTDINLDNVIQRAPVEGAFRGKLPLIREKNFRRNYTAEDYLDKYGFGMFKNPEDLVRDIQKNPKSHKDLELIYEHDIGPIDVTPEFNNADEAFEYFYNKKNQLKGTPADVPNNPVAQNLEKERRQFERRGTGDPNDPNRRRLFDKTYDARYRPDRRNREYTGEAFGSEKAKNLIKKLMKDEEGSFSADPFKLFRGSKGEGLSKTASFQEQWDQSIKEAKILGIPYEKYDNLDELQWDITRKVAQETIRTKKNPLTGK